MKKYLNGQLVDLTEEEIAEREAEELAAPSAFEKSIEELRAKRNGLLQQTDYLALSDNTMSDEMKTYRQDLRDITDGLTSVEEVEAVEFPEKPE